MRWIHDKQYTIEPFELEADLESAIEEVYEELFGPTRVYLEVKKKIGGKGKLTNIPDAYLIDLSSAREPKLYVVENELSKHDPLKHIAVQILKFSLSFETTPQRVKTFIKERLQTTPAAMKQCARYAKENGFENVDYLLERMVCDDGAFHAMVIIDELDPELKTVLISRFQFPVEIIELRRFCARDGQRIYQFTPFLADVFDARETGDANTLHWVHPTSTPSSFPHKTKVSRRYLLVKTGGIKTVFTAA